jgi:hypothetical protein
MKKGLREASSPIRWGQGGAREKMKEALSEAGWSKDEETKYLFTNGLLCL